MHPSTKKRILLLIERAGYVVVKRADHDRREQLISELETELTRRAERVGELEKVRAALTKELDRVDLAERRLAEADREFRLGRERDARGLEAARAETWQFRVLAAELRQQLDDLRQERSERTDLLDHSLATADDQPVKSIAPERGGLDERSSILDENRQV